MVVRSIVFVLSALVVAAGCLGPAQARGQGAQERWVSSVVNRIDAAERKEAGDARRKGTVTVRLRVARDGSLDGVSVEQASGSTELDERAVRAVKTASPFTPPPKRLLSMDGFTELSFPIEFGSGGGR